MTNAVNLASLAGTGFALRNKLINGGMEVAQRGTNFVNPSNAYVLDRWFTASTNCNIAQVNFGPNKALSFNYTGATNVSFIDQPLEGSTAKQLGGKTVTFSVNAAAGTGTPSLSLMIYKNSTADTRTGGAWSLITSSTFTLSTSYLRYSITANIPNDGTASGILVQIVPGTNQPSGTAIYVSQCQLEEGTVPTPFENRPYGLELALCQRYFQYAGNNFSGATDSASNYAINVAFPVMRAIPTVSVRSGGVFSARYAGGDVNITNPTVNATQSDVDGTWTLIASSGLTANLPVAGRHQNTAVNNFLSLNAEL